MREGEAHFDQFKQSAKRPANIKSQAWEAGMAVVETLLEMGRPKNIVKDSVCGPDFPNKYDVEGDTVEFMPHWGYVIVQTPTERRIFPLESYKHSSEEVVEKVKGNIAGFLWQK